MANVELQIWEYLMAAHLGRQMMASKAVHMLIPESYECVILHGKGELRL